MIKVLVVDDSALMRSELSKMLETDPLIKVVGTARHGGVVMAKIKEVDPDIITLDVNMPVMDGLEVLQVVMEQHPLPVIMVSARTEEGAEETIKALAYGAFDFIHKPSGSVSLDISKQTEELIKKVKLAVQTGRDKLRKRATFSLPKHEKPAKEMLHVPPGQSESPHIIGIGVSTGGPHTLYEMLPVFPADWNVSLLIVQHMPEKFTHKLASHLDEVCAMRVKEAEDQEIIERGTVYIAKGGQHMEVTARNERIQFIKIRPGTSQDINCPSVDVLFHSLCQVLGKRWLGVVLTGMGSDGAEGVARLRKMGGHSIVESEETCTVFGMPKRAIERGGAEFILPIGNIPQKIIDLYKTHAF
ncbi:chemotaxis response regulator protein-glutamate methylesterase [Deltaproteobacteria bacterium TL4]